MDKKEVAKALGVSTRRVEQYAKDGELGEVKYVRGRTGKVADYTPERVEALKLKLETPDTQIALAPNRPAAALAIVEQIATGLERQHADAERVAGLLESIRDALANGHKPEAVRVTEKLTLSVAEAAQLSGFSKKSLREAINAGALKAQAVKGRRGWTIKRPDLDAYVSGLQP